MVTIKIDKLWNLKKNRHRGNVQQPQGELLLPLNLFHQLLMI